MPLEQTSENDRQSVLAEVERLHHEYLEATREFERALFLVPAAHEHPQSMNALIDAAKTRKLALDRYVAAAAKAAAED